MKSLTIIFILLIGVMLYFFLAQRSMIYFPPQTDLPATLPENVEIIELHEGYAMLLPSLTNTRTPEPLLIFAHGNAAAAYWMIEEMSVMRAAGFNVLLLEYPGYVGAPGKPSLKSIKRSALAAFDEVVARPHIDASRVVMYGQSIGGGVASIVASERQVAALGLESSYTKLTKLIAEKRMPFFLLRDRFDNESIVKDLEIPVFLYHGTKDTTIPAHHSERLSELAKNSIFVKVDCGHNDCPPAWNKLLEFLNAQNII